MIYEVSSSYDEEIKKTFIQYTQVLQEYKDAHFQIALKGFEVLEHENTSRLYQLYIQRCQEYIETPPLHFDGIYKAMEK